MKHPDPIIMYRVIPATNDQLLTIVFIVATTHEQAFGENANAFYAQMLPYLDESAVPSMREIMDRV